VKYLSDVQLAERYSVSRASVWRWTSRGLLPPPVKFSEGCTRWRLDEIEERDAKLEAARDQRAA